MPKIRFSNLPRGLWHHLSEKVREREISLTHLARLPDWINLEPHAPDGDWYKDFGSFKLCDSGEYPRTVLTEEMAAFGAEVSRVRREDPCRCAPHNPLPTSRSQPSPLRPLQMPAEGGTWEGPTFSSAVFAALPRRP